MIGALDSRLNRKTLPLPVSTQVLTRVQVYLLLVGNHVMYEHPIQGAEETLLSSFRLWKPVKSTGLKGTRLERRCFPLNSTQ